MKPLEGKRILVCGKGGSGKSSVVSLLAKALQSKTYKVIVLDGDASNPGGLLRLVTGDSAKPRSLMDYFGGREKVTCPVDDPSPLIRTDNKTPVIEMHLDPDKIPPEYYVKKNNLTLFQVGKIQNSFEGCDGPMSKITRDFIVEGPYVTLMDVEAGIEHFGRGIEKNVDSVLTVVDPTFESFEISGRVKELSRSMNIKVVMCILNAVRDEAMEDIMKKKLTERELELLGIIKHDHKIFQAGLEGTPIDSCIATEETCKMVHKLETHFR